MNFLDKIFDWFSGLSAKIPSFDVKGYFFVVLGIILLVGVIIAFTYFDSSKYKLLKASKKIIKYLGREDVVDDDNLSEFTAQCFSKNAPQSLRDAWIEYVGVRFGYPSEIVSEKNVFDKEIKKADRIRPNIFLTIGLILVALFAFFGFGALSKNAMSVIHCFGLILVALIYFGLLLIGKALYKKSLKTFFEMQEDLDSKVNLPIETSYSTDSSPLNEIAGILDSIIARNVSKIVDFSEETEQNESTENVFEGCEQSVDSTDLDNSLTDSKEDETVINKTFENENSENESLKTVVADVLEIEEIKDNIENQNGVENSSDVESEIDLVEFEKENLGNQDIQTNETKIDEDNTATVNVNENINDEDLSAGIDAESYIDKNKNIEDEMTTVENNSEDLPIDENKGTGIEQHTYYTTIVQPFNDGVNQFEEVAAESILTENNNDAVKIDEIEKTEVVEIENAEVIEDTKTEVVEQVAPVIECEQSATTVEEENDVPINNIEVAINVEEQIENSQNETFVEESLNYENSNSNLEINQQDKMQDEIIASESFLEREDKLNDQQELKSEVQEIEYYVPSSVKSTKPVKKKFKA